MLNNLSERVGVLLSPRGANAGNFERGWLLLARSHELSGRASLVIDELAMGRVARHPKLPCLRESNSGLLFTPPIVVLLLSDQREYLRRWRSQRLDPTDTSSRPLSG